MSKRVANAYINIISGETKSINFVLNANQFIYINYKTVYFNMAYDLQTAISIVDSKWKIKREILLEPQALIQEMRQFHMYHKSLSL